MESVIRVALLLSMVVIAPLGDLIGAVRAARRARERTGARRTSCWTGSRITLVFASLIVLGGGGATRPQRSTGEPEEKAADADA